MDENLCTDMVFIYDNHADLDEKMIVAVKNLMIKGFRWIWERWHKGGFTVERAGEKYLMKEYGAEEMRKLKIWSGAEWLAKVEPKVEREIDEEDLEKLLRKYYVAHNYLSLYSVPFPPLKYLKARGVRYDEKAPFFLDTQIGNVVDVFKYEKKKNAVIVDFWSVDRYLDFSDPPLSIAVEDFLLDLTKDVIMETEPLYAYMNLYDEWIPLQYDPLCDNNKEIRRYVSRKIEEDDEELRLRNWAILGHICYIPKEIVDGAVAWDLRRVYHQLEKEFEEIVVEDFGTHYLLHFRGLVDLDSYRPYQPYCSEEFGLREFRISIKATRHYFNTMFYPIRNTEWEYELFVELREETKVPIKWVCGNKKDGYVVWMLVNEEWGDYDTKRFKEEREEILRRLNNAGKKYGVYIREVRPWYRFW